jgi:starch phosphorylase
MTMVCMRMAGIVNGVSKLHAEKAKEVWTSHPMVGITNGVHVPTWNALAHVDMDTPGSLYGMHQERKKKLLEFLRTYRREWDPDTLLLGWARRITRYKRPLAVFEDLQRFAAIARNQEHPVRLVIAGQPHPNDQNGLDMLTELRAVTEGELKDVALYIPEYSIAEAQQLVAGCDLWMNTPILGFEASGTSGMKAALNGVLPFSTRDGWVAEVDLFGIGWPLNSDRIGADLLDVLERDIAPMYYRRNEDGIPGDWEENMRRARMFILERFSATRMLKEYTELLYS